MVTLAGSPPKAAMFSRTQPQGGDDVEEPGVARPGDVVADEVGEVEVAEDAEAVVQGDDDDVAGPAQVDAVVEHDRAGPGLEAAAVQPHQHRAALARRATGSTR